MPSLYIGEQPVRTVALASNNDDATAVAADVMKDKIAYNQYGKIVGTAEPAEDLDSEMTAQDSLIEQISAAVEGKAGVVLPTLSNPATAENIENGYQAIGSDGEVIDGTNEPVSKLIGFVQDSPERNVPYDVTTLDSSKKYLIACYQLDTARLSVYRYENGTLTSKASGGYVWCQMNGTTLQVLCNQADYKTTYVDVVEYI